MSASPSNAGSSIPIARRLSRRGPAGRLALLLLLVAATVGLAACGGDDDPGAEDEAEPLGRLRAGSAAPLAQCRDWRQGTAAERRATVENIRESLAPQDAPPAPAATLSDEEAYEVLENACANDFARGFRLYKLYARAAAFQPLSD